MTRAIRNLTFVAVLAAGALLVPGCEQQNDCSLMPDLNHAPTSCSMPASSTVTVNVRWCSCSSSITCSVTNEGGGFFQAEPKVTQCDASCDSSGASCGTEVVPCVFETPTTDFTLVVRGGQTDQNVGVTVGGGSSSCGP